MTEYWAGGIGAFANAFGRICLITIVQLKLEKEVKE